MIKKITVFGSLLLILGLYAGSVSAQEAIQNALNAAIPGSPDTPAIVVPPKGGLTEEELNRPFLGALLMSPVEMTVVRQAISGKISSAVPEVLQANAPAVIPPDRVISVGGVFYRTPGNWVVWMNGHKVTPKSLLPEIVDIVVRDSSKVNLQWYDAGLNKVIAITLRPHQTYDIPTGILLPGSR